MHRSLATTDIHTYLTDIEANRLLIDALEKRIGQRTRYFRAPFLEEGNTEADRRALRDYLAKHEYKIARVSIDFADWVYAEPYGRCLTQGNQDGLGQLRTLYVANAMTNLAWSLAAAQKVVGHPITHVLLLHATLVTSQALDAMLTEFDRAGVHYATLAEALSQDVYTEPYDLSGGATVLVQASRALGMRPPVAPARPLKLLDRTCR